MQSFLEWLIEASQPIVDPSVLKGYEFEFRRQLQGLIQRTENPLLRQQFLNMLECPITDSNGRCRDFSEYVLSALIKSGVHYRYDVEDALNYVMTQMLMDRSLQSGQPRQTLFGGFEDRPTQPGENPLQARFMTFLTNAVRNITSGRIARLADTNRPAGSLSIGSGRSKHDQGFVSPDEIDGGVETHEQDLMSDILTLLQRKEKAFPGLPLVDLFKSMIAGETSREQRARFGYRSTDQGRKIVMQVIRDYATSTGNHRLLGLLGKMAGETQQPLRVRTTQAKPKLSPQDQDFASIVSVIERKGGSVTHAVLGSLRRRWLERPPRDPHSPHKNRLDDVMANMVDAGVLIAKPTGAGGRRFYPGQNYDKYKELSVQ